jgi:hypothetical protein
MQRLMIERHACAGGGGAAMRRTHKLRPASLHRKEKRYVRAGAGAYEYPACHVCAVQVHLVAVHWVQRDARFYNDLELCNATIGGSGLHRCYFMVQVQPLYVSRELRYHSHRFMHKRCGDALMLRYGRR